MKANKIVSQVKVRIIKNMQSQGFKRYSLAEKAGISNPTIQNWYSTRNYNPTLDSLIKICDALNISLSELFLDENSTMYPVNDELKNMINVYQTLTPENKELLLTLMKKLRKD